VSVSRKSRWHSWLAHRSAAGFDAAETRRKRGRIRFRYAACSHLVRHPFRVPGTGFGFTAGASVGRFEGRASGIRDISDVAGKYEAVGAMVGGFGSVHLRNDKGATTELQGANVGMEFVANVSDVRISLKRGSR
jgi:hypothetical protein